MEETVEDTQVGSGRERENGEGWMDREIQWLLLEPH